MSVSLRVGQTTTLTAVADDPSGTLDPNAIDSWTEVDGAVDADGNSTGTPATTGFITLTGNVATASAVGAAAGSTFVDAAASDPDGKVTRSAPFAVTVNPAFAATDAATVTVTASQPV